MGSIKQTSIHWDKKGGNKIKIPKVKKIKKLDLWGLINGKK